MKFLRLFFFSELIFLQNLGLNKIVSCPLNPLKPCHSAVAQKFAAVARNYQLVYCHSIIERNNRNNLPILFMAENKNLHVDTFFPYDPYLLLTSGKKIVPLYTYSDNVPTETQVPRNNSESVEDDYLEDHFSNMESSSYEKFSYSTSPGFMM